MFQKETRFGNPKKKDDSLTLFMLATKIGDPIVKTYYRLAKGYGITYEELELCKYIAVDKAAQKFDPKKNVSFATYYKVFVKHEILNEIRKSSAKHRLLLRDSLSFDAPVFGDPNGLCYHESIGINEVKNEIYHNELKDFIENCVETKLSKLESIVFVSRQVGESFEGIAYRLGTSASSTKPTYYHALNQIQDEYDRFYSIP